MQLVAENSGSIGWRGAAEFRCIADQAVCEFKESDRHEPGQVTRDCPTAHITGYTTSNSSRYGKI